jgi:hypothetical protein
MDDTTSDKVMFATVTDPRGQRDHPRRAALGRPQWTRNSGQRRPAGHCRLSRIAIVSRRENGARCSSMAGVSDAVDKTLGSSTKAGTRRLIRVRQRGRRAPRPVKAPASGGRRYGVPAERAPRRALPGTDRPSRTGRGRPARRSGIPPRAPTTASLPGRARSGRAEVRVPELARARHADRARAGEPVQRPLGVRVDTGNALPAGDPRALVPAGASGASPRRLVRRGWRRFDDWAPIGGPRHRDHESRRATSRT